MAFKYIKSFRLTTMVCTLLLLSPIVSQAASDDELDRYHSLAG